MIRLLGPQFRLACAAALIAARARGEPVADVLARMDQAAREFKSVSAMMKQVEYTAVIDESTERSGELRLKREKGAVVARVEFQRPEPSVVHIDRRKVQVFYPNAKTVQVYDVAKYGGVMDQVLLFGISGAELQKAYTVTDGGPEMVSGVRATRLDLAPKSKELKEVVTSIQVWIPEGKSNPIQVKAMHAPSKDYKLFTYTDTVVNPALPDSAFELKFPAGTRAIYPQK